MGNGCRRFAGDPQLYQHIATGAPDLSARRRHPDRGPARPRAGDPGADGDGLEDEVGRGDHGASVDALLGQGVAQDDEGLRDATPAALRERPAGVGEVGACQGCEHARHPRPRRRKWEEKEQLDEACHHRCWTLVGKLMWMLCARPDLAFVVELARALQAPTREDELALQRVLKYLIATRDYTLHVEIGEKAPQDLLTLGVDASWANAADRKSTSGGIVQLQGFILNMVEPDAGRHRTKHVCGRAFGAQRGCVRATLRAAGHGRDGHERDHHDAQ